MIEQLDIGLGGDVTGVSPERAAFTERPYQIKISDAVREGWKKYTKQFIEAATGCGKTIIFSAICKEFVNEGKRCLVIAHRDELVNQARDKMHRFYGIDAGKEKASDHGSLHDDVVVASVQTIGGDRRLLSWPADHFGLVVVDECHRTLAPTYIKVLDYFHAGGAKILGVTATSDRGDKRNLGEFYEHCAYEYNLLDACKDGYLVPPIVVQVPIEIDLTKIKSERTPEGSDYKRSELVERISPLLDQIAVAISEEAANRKTLIFMPSIETSKFMADSLRQQGLAADFVSGACRDRSQKVAKYISGETQYLCNAMLLTEGFDDDNTACITNLRATKIRSLFCQMIGRGTRTLTGLIDGIESKEERLSLIKNSAKPNLMILDFLWLTDKLDLICPVDLVCGGRKEIRERMMNADQGDLIHMKEEAEKDLLAALEENVRENTTKRKRVIDPLKFAVITGDALLADWEPTEPWHSAPMTEGQRSALERAGIDAEAVVCKGLASRIIDRLFKRQRLGLATAKQLVMMSNLGFKEGTTLSIIEATDVIGRLLAEKKAEKDAKAAEKEEAVFPPTYDIGL